MDTIYVCPSSIIHHLACVAKAMGHTRIEQVFTFAHVEWWNIVQVRMLHQKT